MLHLKSKMMKKILISLAIVMSMTSFRGKPDNDTSRITIHATVSRQEKQRLEEISADPEIASRYIFSFSIDRERKDFEVRCGDVSIGYLYGNLNKQTLLNFYPRWVETYWDVVTHRTETVQTQK